MIGVIPKQSASAKPTQLFLKLNLTQVQADKAPTYIPIVDEIGSEYSFERNDVGEFIMTFDSEILAGDTEIFIAQVKNSKLNTATRISYNEIQINTDGDLKLNETLLQIAIPNP